MTLRSLWKYLALGLAFCAVGELVFWFELGGDGVLLWPFVWAYSQEAMVALIADGGHVVLWVWLVAYVLISIILWLCVESRGTSARWPVWWRVVGAWIITQALLGVIAWGLFRLNVLDME